MNCPYADIDYCQPDAVVTSPNSCSDDCIKLLTCGHSACGEFYFCAKHLKSVIKSSSKAVACCLNDDGHDIRYFQLDLYSCVYKIVNGGIATYVRS